MIVIVFVNVKIFTIIIIFIRKPLNVGPGAMKLGGKSRDVDSFVDQLKEEGENVVSGPLAVLGTKSTQTPQIINSELYVTLTIYRSFKIIREQII